VAVGKGLMQRCECSLIVLPIDIGSSSYKYSMLLWRSRIIFMRLLPVDIGSSSYKYSMLLWRSRIIFMRLLPVDIGSSS
jgi:hypothetical protein